MSESAGPPHTDGFAQRIHTWSLARGAQPGDSQSTADAAKALSLAQANGHVCLLLDDSAPPTGAATWRDSLIASGVVGTPEEPGAMPLILDARNRLYLHRYFDYERRLATRLMRAATMPSDPESSEPRLRERLRSLFASNAAGLAGACDWQMVAAALALRQHLTVISGGPGTGKTTTVVNLLACLLELDPDCRIGLAAPTGKAAARMTEAIRHRASHLPAALRERLPAESSTVHRLLGYRPFDGGFTHDSDNPLPIDALVVDEASMLDLALATRLFEAVPASARIVLLGDKDQLAAVEAGAVFSELGVDPTLSADCIAQLAAMTGIEAGLITAPRPRAPSALQDTVVWFGRNFRFAAESGIGRMAALVNIGEASSAIDWLRPGSDSSVRWIDGGGADQSARLSQAALDTISAGYAHYVEAVDREAADIDAIASAFGRFRVLCAVRKSVRGVLAINTSLENCFRARAGAPPRDPRSPWYPGRPVMVLRNDPVLRLYNGDIGFALPEADGAMMVRFPEPDGSWRAVAPLRLPPHETAFAMTVHKAQGAEFDEVLLVLPARESRVLTRELVYTGITRARERVTISANEAVLRAGIETRTERRSGLLERLREQLPADASI